MVNISLAKIEKRGIKRSRSRGIMICYLTRSRPGRNLAMGGTYMGLVRNIPTRVPSALVVRTHLADLVYTLLCSHLRSSLADVSCFHMKIFFFLGGGCIFWYKYATCPSTSNSPGWPCVYALVLNWKDNLVFCLYWPGLNWSNLFANCYPYICRSRQDSMSLLSQTFSQIILQIIILHFNDSYSGTSI